MVLSILTEEAFELMAKVPLREHNYKVVFLVVVYSARRMSELGELSIKPNPVVFLRKGQHFAGA